MVESLVACPIATRPPHLYVSVSSHTSTESSCSGEVPKSRCMSMSTSNSRAISNTRRICAGMVGVVVRRRADRLRATLEAFDHQFVGARIVGEALLRHHAELDVDRPLVFVDQRLHALEPAHADQRIDLDMRAHARRAVLDAALQRLARAPRDVLDRHGVLHVGHALHRVVVAAVLRRAAIDDARLVEMDMRLDQPAAAQATRGVVGRRIADEVRLDRRDAALLEADVGRRVVAACTRALRIT